MDIQIKPLSKETKGDYLLFFDNIVFKENPDRHKCYCYDFHFTGDVDSCTRAQSRAAVSELIDKGMLTGYLAFDQDKPIGWCNVNNRANYQRLLRDYNYVDNPVDRVCSIVCFTIHPDYRRRGIAQQLLEQIIVDYANSDFDYFEAYPKKSESSCEGNFRGPLGLYEKFGFKINREDKRHFVVRREIG